MAIDHGSYERSRRMDEDMCHAPGDGEFETLDEDRRTDDDAISVASDVIDVADDCIDDPDDTILDHEA
jgi:hypothetical protein